MIKAVIFDCFGVIYPDTLSLVERPYLSKGDARKEAIRSLRRQSDKGLISRDDFWDGAAKILDIPRSEIDTQLAKVQGADWDLLEYIKKLKEAYKTAMLSNVGRGFLERIFNKEHPQEDYFDVVLASADIGHMKPHEQAYVTVAEKLSLEPRECIFIDDLEKNVAGAQKVGMRALLYTDFNKLKTDLENLLPDTNS